MGVPSLAAVRSATTVALRRTAPAAMERLARFTQHRAGATLYHVNDPADDVYRLVGGAARKCSIMADGRRAIVDFLLPGDLFGFDARFKHSFSVEIIVDGATIARFPRLAVEQLAEVAPEVGHYIRESAFECIARLQWRMILLGSTTAVEKVSAFLVEMAERSVVDAANVILLPMSREDIADYLALATETVSRALTKLRREGAIGFAGPRGVRIIDRGALPCQPLGMDCTPRKEAAISARF
jgi:CRP-like cAMP-binding protein